jgi:hypothetical protein
MNYEDDIRIDDSALDVEWCEQANLSMRYGKHYAECRKALTLSEEKIKIVRAELIKLANQDPDRYLGSGVKPTAPNIEAFYRNHVRHKAAKDEWVEAQYELNMAEVAKNEISFTRKAALEALVTLHGQNYFAGPKMPRNLTEERANWDKKVSAGISAKIQRRRTS